VYVLVRRDISPGQQVVQACHAAAKAAVLYNGKLEVDPHVVVCGVKTETALFRAIEKLNENGIRCQWFIEPDMGNQVTAIATEPVYGDARRVFRNYQLLKPEAPKQFAEVSSPISTN
jgi:hypothetical protein